MEKPSVIPKTAHFIWLNDNPKLPSAEQQSLNEFVAFHPDWRVNLVTSIPQNMPPELVECVHACKKVCQQADVIRSWLLFDEGGIYSDLDIFWVRALDGEALNRLNFCITHGAELRRIRRRPVPPPFRFNNAVMGSVGRTPFFERYLQIIKGIVERGGPYRRNAFGPMLLRRIMKRRQRLLCDPLPPQAFGSLYLARIDRRRFSRLDLEERRETLARHSWRWTSRQTPYGVHASDNSFAPAVPQ